MCEHSFHYITVFQPKPVTHGWVESVDYGLCRSLTLIFSKSRPENHLLIPLHLSPLPLLWLAATESKIKTHRAAIEAAEKHPATLKLHYAAYDCMNWSICGRCVQGLKRHTSTQTFWDEKNTTLKLHQAGFLCVIEVNLQQLTNWDVVDLPK